jgi:thiol:disulfide interchange protein DsbA
MKRRTFTQQLLGGAGAFGLLSLADSVQAQGQPVEGVHFKRLEAPQPVGAGGKLEVLEFFSYGCPHCAELESFIQAWLARLPADVAFRRVPVPFLMNAENFQRTYYALEAMGAVDTFQHKIFAAVHVDRLRLSKPEDIAAVIAKAGGDATKFLQVFNSFSVTSKLGQGQRMAQAYRIEGVPTLVVQGRWVTSPSQAKGGMQALAVVDFLLQRSRSAGRG